MSGTVNVLKKILSKQKKQELLAESGRSTQDMPQDVTMVSD
jgi:hypothetical protein